MEIKVLSSGSKGNCYTINDGFTTILIEAGTPWKKLQQALNFQAHTICSALISHSHGDHAKYVQELLKAGIDVYASNATWDEIQAEPDHRGHVIRVKEQFRNGSWYILPFDAVHDVENLGFLLQSTAGYKVLYLTDTMYCRYRFNGLTHIMVECNYDDEILKANVDAGIVPLELKNRIIRSHFSLTNVKEFFKANDLSQVQEIHLIHLSDNNSDSERFKQEVQAVTGKPVYIA